MTENNKKEQNIPQENIEEDEKVNISNKDSKESVEEKTVDEKLQETEEKLLRSLAEVENQRRRFEKEVRDAFEFGSFNFAKESLAILDNFLENITIIEKDLASIFEKNRIKKIETKDKKFDPNFHQSMTEIDDENAAPGTILQEIQAGYMLGERLLRPALVGVAKKDEKNKGKKEEK